MINLRGNKNWLRHRVNVHIKPHHKDFFEPWHKSIVNKLLNYISERDRYILVPVIVFAVFAISFLIDFDYFNIVKITPKTLYSIVDQRTANIVIISSITLVVVGFLISNLAVKSPITYMLLFKKSFLYPIIYLTLSTIACLILTSTLRDTIDFFYFSRAVLAGTFLALLILILIGFLFRTIIKFTNDKEIAKMLDRELMREAKENTKEILLKKYSKEQYVNLMHEKGLKEYDWSEALDSSDTKIEFKEVSQEEIIKRQTKEKIIHDINMNRISKYISKKKPTQKMYYQRREHNTRQQDRV